LITLAALAMVAFQTRRVVAQKKLELDQLQSELDTKSFQDSAQLNKKYRETNQALIDLRSALQENRERCEQAMTGIVERYATIERRDPAQLSIRSYPTLRSDSERASTAFLVSVPTDRTVWLKLGMHQSRQSPADGIKDSEKSLIQDAPFDVVGPFELPLPAGEHVVYATVERPQQGQLTVRLRLDDRVLAEIKNRAGTSADTSGSMSIAAMKQVDYGPKRPLPRLLTQRLDVREDPNSEQEVEYSLSVWLSRTSSAFVEFPEP